MLLSYSTLHYLFTYITAKSLSIDSQQLAKRCQANQEGRIYQYIQLQAVAPLRHSGRSCPSCPLVSLTLVILSITAIRNQIREYFRFFQVVQIGWTDPWPWHTFYYYPPPHDSNGFVHEINLNINFMRKLFSFKSVNISDSTILAAQHGDRKAQENVIRDCTGLTAGLIKSFGRSLNTYSAEELTRIGMWVTFKCLSGFDPEKGTQFTAYVRSAIHKKFITMANEQKRFVSIDEGWDNEDSDEARHDFTEYDSEYSTSRMEDRENAAVHLRHLLEYTDITPCERRVLDVMIRLTKAGISPTDEMIAKRLGISHQAVSKSRKKLFSKLRKTDKRLNQAWGLAG